MKRYLIKLSQPVIVDDSTAEETKQATIYGFLGPVIVDDDQESYDYLVYDINSYVDYLAAMDVRNAVVEKDFDIDKDENLIAWSQRISEIGRKSREETGLTFTLSVVDLEGINKNCIACGMDRSFIICGALMEDFTRLAEQQAEEVKTAQYNVILFNRPIWLPKRILWKGEDGFSHIYGVTIDQEIDRQLLKDCNLYLGYLAMIEELTLNNVTPSGYTADLEKDGSLWYDRGEGYTYISEKIKEECNLCRHKHNLKLRGAVVRIPEEELNKGVKDEYILSQELYEQLVAIVANTNYETGCRNENPDTTNETPLQIETPPYQCPKC